MALETIADGLTSPVAMAEAPDGSERLFVVDQIGLIRVITADGELLEDPFLDIRDQIVTLSESYDERGLLGLAFHPEYAENGRFFVYYSAPLRPGAPEEWNNTSHLSEYRVTSDPLLADPSSERVLMRVDEPQSNHAGGTVAFGPDDYLYLSLGDGGAAGDVGVGHPIPGNGQDPGTILGSILRIDVDSGDPYGIPEDNPFATGSGEEEVYAYGSATPTASPSIWRGRTSCSSATPGRTCSRRSRSSNAAATTAGGSRKARTASTWTTPIRWKRSAPTWDRTGAH